MKYDEKISQKGAGKKISSLEENGYILDYTPVVNPTLFGTPYLVTITFDDTYRDIQSYLDAIVSFLETRYGFAIIVSFTIKRETTMQLQTVILTDRINQFAQELLNAASLNNTIVRWEQIVDLKGIPDYGDDSMKK